MENNPVVSRDEWLVARKALSGQGEGVHAGARRARRRAPRPALGQGREIVCLRRPAGKGNAGRPVRRPQPARRSTTSCSAPTGRRDVRSCSHWADSFNGTIVHFNHRDVTMVAVSRAPYAKARGVPAKDGLGLQVALVVRDRFQLRLSGFLHAGRDRAEGRALQFHPWRPARSEREGVSVFFKDPAGTVFHTYSAYARGIDPMSVDYQYLDLVPKGRDEDGRGPYWIRRHDEYGA